jgi:hypothetical protein
MFFILEVFTLLELGETEKTHFVPSSVRFGLPICSKMLVKLTQGYNKKYWCFLYVYFYCDPSRYLKNYEIAQLKFNFALT